MEPFEEKLKNYFDQVQPDGEFMDRLKALENSSEAKPLPRGKPRRWVTPVAAGVAAALALGTGWAYLRGTLPGNAPEPTPAYSAPAPDTQAAGEPAPEAPSDPEPPAPAVPDEPVPRTPAQEAHQPPAQKTPAPTPEQPSGAAASADSPSKDSLPDNLPDVGTEPYEPAPEPGALPEDEPAHAGPENDPPRKPEEKPDPPEETPNETGSTPIIFAQYQATDSGATLTLSSLLTGQTAVVDVTGQLPPPKEPSQPGNPGEEAASAASESGEPSIYTGYCTAFGWQIRYTLSRDGADSIFAVAVAETPESERSLS